MEASDFLISLFRDNFFCASLEGEMEEGKKSKKKKNEKLESRRRGEREEFNEFKFEIKFFLPVSRLISFFQFLFTSRYCLAVV